MKNYQRIKRQAGCAIAMVLLLLWVTKSSTIRTEMTNEKTMDAEAVKQMIRHSWKGYVECAWGHDEAAPVGCSSVDWGDAPIGLTIIDSMDTLHLAGMKNEYQKCIEYLQSPKHTFDVDVTVSFFEATIRILGGLLTAYELTPQQPLLDKAVDLADRLMSAYTGGNGVLPTKYVNLKHRKGLEKKRKTLCLAEAGSVQLEFWKLSKLTGNNTYKDVSGKVLDFLYENKREDNLWPVEIDSKTSLPYGRVTLGGRGDSFVEYVAKLYLATGDEKHRHIFEGMVHAIQTNLMVDGKLIERNETKIIYKMDHLACFLPGLYAMMSVKCKACQYKEEMLSSAIVLGDLCYDMYEISPSGLAPNAVYFSDTPPHPIVSPLKKSLWNLLRPEALEAWYWLSLATKDAKYSLYTQRVLRSFNEHSRVASGGYTCLKDVTRPRVKIDHMHSFWLAETLKYGLLTLSGTELEGKVFNTEGHAFKI